MRELDGRAAGLRSRGTDALRGAREMSVQCRKDEEDADALAAAAERALADEAPPPPPPPRNKWTRRFPHPVLIGHAASLGRRPGALRRALKRTPRVLRRPSLGGP